MTGAGGGHHGLVLELLPIQMVQVSSGMEPDWHSRKETLSASKIHFFFLVQ